MGAGVVKIMYLADTYENPFAGTEGQMKMLISGLDRNKYEPHMTLLRHSDYIERNGFACPVSVLGIKSMTSIDTFKKMYLYARKLKKEGFDLVHIFFNDASIIAPLFLKLYGMKVIISRRDMGYWYTASRLAILKFNGIFIDHVIVNSIAVKHKTNKSEGIKARKISVIYNGYDDVGLFSNDSKMEFSQYGIKESDLILGQVANIRPLKRIDDVIRAMPIILQKHSNAKFIHVGGGNNEELKELARSLGVADSVIFVGQQKDPKYFMRRFNVAVLSSESEGFSNAIVEYMKSKTPVVCTNVGGNSEIVQDGETGYLIEMGDVNALAEKVISLFSYPALMEKMAAAGYQFAEEKYKKEIMLDMHEELYSEMIR